MTCYRIRCTFEEVSTEYSSTTPTVSSNTISVSYTPIRASEVHTPHTLYEEVTTDSEKADALFEQPFDEAELYKLAKRFPSAKMVEICVDSRTETSDWEFVKKRSEVLP